MSRYLVKKASWMLIRPASGTPFSQRARSAGPQDRSHFEGFPKQGVTVEIMMIPVLSQL